MECVEIFQRSRYYLHPVDEKELDGLLLEEEEKEGKEENAIP